jgi:excisionase family DNA binding protein
MRLTLSQMAEKLNRCPKTFRKYVDELDIPYIQLGRDFLFDEAEVIAYLRVRTVEKKSRRRFTATRIRRTESALAKRLQI